MSHLKGKKPSLEARKKMREAKLKNPVRYWLGKKRLDMVGKNNHKWKGDDVGYNGVHSWLVRRYGQPNKCDKCGTIKSKRYEWANVSGQYKRDRNDYQRLCVKCHRELDGNNLDLIMKRPEMIEMLREKAYERKRDNSGRFVKEMA